MRQPADCTGNICLTLERFSQKVLQTENATLENIFLCSILELQGFFSHSYHVIGLK